MNTAELLVKCLENEGVKVVFGIPGEENLAVMNALARSNIRFITVRHEQGAAFMADVYGRLTAAQAFAWRRSVPAQPTSSPAWQTPIPTARRWSPSPGRFPPTKFT